LGFTLLEPSTYSFFNKFGGLADNEIAEVLKDIEQNNLEIKAAQTLIDDAKGRRYFDFISFIILSRYVRLCLLVFLVNYLNLKFKVARRDIEAKARRKLKRPRKFVTVL